MQFAIVYHLPAHNRLMTNHQKFEYVVVVAKIEKFLHKIVVLFDSSSWGMVQIMHFVLLNCTKTPFSSITFIVVNVNELTPIDNTQWL